MEPAHSHSIGLSKTHRMPLSADSGPRQAPQMQKFPKCRSPCRLQADFPRTARAVRLFCGELLSVRKKHPGNGRRRSADRAPSREPEPRPLSPSYYTRFRRCRQVRIEKKCTKRQLCFEIRLTFLRIRVILKMYSCTLFPYTSIWRMRNRYRPHRRDRHELKKEGSGS